MGGYRLIYILRKVLRYKFVYDPRYNHIIFEKMRVVNIILSFQKYVINLHFRKLVTAQIY